MEASGLEKIPSGKLVMAFPVREALAVPLVVQTTDEAMFDDLVSMHLEKSGVREKAPNQSANDHPAGESRRLPRNNI